MARVTRRLLIASIAALGLLAGLAAGAPAAGAETRISYAKGKLVPIPDSIPHEAGDMVDSRIVPDLLWISQRYPVYVTDGYSGPLPGKGWAGCRGCHTRNSDHHVGLAVDIVPLVPSSRCDAKWAAVSRLARWAEPRPNRPRAPFRWVGYDGDSGHGCGHHLHLSWNHAPAREYSSAAWVELLSPEGAEEPAPAPKQRKPKRVKKTVKVKPKAPAGPTGGVSLAATGGVGARR